MKQRPFTGSVLVAILVVSSLSLPARASSPTGDTENIELVGHIGGSVYALSVQGDYAYAGMGNELAILDISDPTTPVRTSSLTMSTLVVDVQVLAGALPGQLYAYVALHLGGLKVVDVSNPSAPVEVGAASLGSWALDLSVLRDAASGRTYALVTCSAGLAGYELQIVDVSDPAHPVRVFWAWLNEAPHDIAAAVAPTGQLYAYITVQRGLKYQGLRVMDVSDPTAPVQVGLATTPGLAFAVAVAWPYAYVADGEGGLRVIDVSHPDDPFEVGSYSVPGFAQEVAVSGGYAYVSHREAGLRIVDVSDPSLPTETGAYNPSGYAGAVAVTTSPLPGEIHAVVSAEGGLDVVDVSVPVAPLGVGSYAFPQWARHVTVMESEPPDHMYAYVIDASGLYVVDVSAPGSPVMAGFRRLPGEPLGVTVARDGSTGNTYAYVATCEAGLRVADVSDPANPAEVGSCAIPDCACAVTVAEGNVPGQMYAYVAAGTSGLRVVDVSNPAGPFEVGSVDTPDRAYYDVAVAGGNSLGQIYAYVAGGGGLRIVDVSDPTAPVQAGLATTPGLAFAVAVVWPYAYVADGGLRVLDVSDPTAPAEVGFDTSRPAEAVTVEDNIVYYAGVAYFPSYGYPGLTVSNVSDPASPLPVGFYDLAGKEDVAVAGGTIYLAGGASGLSILRFTDLEINGRVSQANGLPVPGVEVSAGLDLLATTGTDGAYSLPDIDPGTYTVTPSMPGYAFEPPSRTLTVPPKASGVNFTMLALPVSTTLAPGLPGTLTYTDTQGLTTTFDFPADAVTQTTTVVLTPTLSSRQVGYAFAGHAFDLAAFREGVLQPGLAFGAPVSITLLYSDRDVRVVTVELDLALWRQSDGGWQDATQSCDPATVYSRDTEGNVLGVPICRVGRFALFGPTQQIYLPLISRSWP